ncbi:MAG TPA: PLP-dependent transferase [Candidatus Lokiarchaeia archaeon]|nr:PLP-dependent transferase [Candidatus Lokiarchaeia archaeon]
MDRTIEQIIADHENLIKNCIRLLPSENIMSSGAKKALISDVSGRYHVKFYGGKEFIMELVEQVTRLAKQVFHAEHAFVTPLSGNLSVLATLLAFTKVGDKVAMVSSNAGYPLNLEFYKRARVALPFNEMQFNLDSQATLELIDKEKPRLIYLGTSFILHPIPDIEQIINSMHEHDGIVVYDGSHVLGLIAGGQFQDPLGAGADVLIGSTHKSFFGPQGGIIITNSSTMQKKLARSASADPEASVVLVDNPHPGRIAALGIALEEMVDHGERYALQVVNNARALQSALLETSLNDQVAGMAQGPTDSHQVCLRVENSNDGMSIMKHLETYAILCDAGVRLGTAEATRLGYVEDDLQQIGQWIGEILDPAVEDDALQQVKRDVEEMVQLHQEIVL